MPPETIRAALPVEQEDRYSRLRLIPWWNQRKLATARVLVVGAGALGNEVLKNLALLGVANVVVVDLDQIETSNLSRSILFRAENVGETKASAAARAYRSLQPGANVQPIVGNITQDCGLGLFTWADVTLAGLDNREARLWINRAAWKTGRPWVDGAIEGINGVVRVFLPGTAPCYECTLGETDWAILNRRMSCNLLLHEESTQGRVPTTPTISSIIAGIEVQEAVKLLHGLPVLAGKGYVFEGLHHSSYVVEYTENPDCMSHYTLDRVVQLDAASHAITLEELADRARQDLDVASVAIEFSRDIIHKLVCPVCREEEEIFSALGSVSYEQGACPRDGSMRIVETLSGYRGELWLAARPLDRLGLPLFDIFVARAAASGGDAEIAYCLAGDAAAVLGPLAPSEVPA